MQKKYQLSYCRLEKLEMNSGSFFENILGDVEEEEKKTRDIFLIEWDVGVTRLQDDIDSFSKKTSLPVFQEILKDVLFL